MPKEEATPVDDIIETINHFQCFDYMIDVADQELTEEMIKVFHTFDQVAYFRQQKRMVQDVGITRPNRIWSAKTEPFPQQK